jgi:hypothetical protein
VLLAAALLATANASADVTTADCVDANSKAQTARRSGKFAEARKLLLTCTNPSCPSLIRDDCSSRFDELNRVQPTIVFTAKDATGADVGAVTVTMDGQLLIDKLDGTAIAVDPGQHVFAFTVAGRAPFTRALIVAEGDKNRREVIDVGGDATPPASTTPSTASTPSASTPPTSPPPEHGGSSHTVGFVVGGAGIAVLGVGAAFGVIALSQKSSADDTCGGHGSVCSTGSQTSAAQSKLQDARTSGWISTAAIGVGAAAVVVGAYLVFFSGDSPSESPAAALAVMPSGAFVTGSF